MADQYHTLTRRNLIEAAGEIFAAKGFDGASIREICKQAGANIAAIHYHFGDKEKLYHAVIRQIVKDLDVAVSIDEIEDSTRSTEDRLFHFIHTLLSHRLSSGHSVWRHKLWVRELQAPRTGMRDQVIGFMRQKNEVITKILRELMGEETSEEVISLCIRSIIGQCFFYHPMNFMIRKMHRGVSFTPEGIEKIAREITVFSLAAVRGLKSSAEGSK